MRAGGPGEAPGRARGRGGCPQLLCPQTGARGASSWWRIAAIGQASVCDVELAQPRVPIRFFAVTAPK